MAHDAGALVLVDGAQAAPKLALDMAELGADFYGFTGPQGSTAQPASASSTAARELLEAMGPYEGGGSMIRKVTKDEITWAERSRALRGGNAADRRGDRAGRRGRMAGRDRPRRRPCPRGRARPPTRSSGWPRFPACASSGPPAGDDRVGIVSFALDGVHAHDVSEILDRHAVAVRAGHHCAQILMERLGVPATTRASFAVYNTREEVDRLIDALHDVRRIFELG